MGAKHRLEEVFIAALEEVLAYNSDDNYDTNRIVPVEVCNEI